MIDIARKQVVKEIKVGDWPSGIKISKGWEDGLCSVFWEHVEHDRCNRYRQDGEGQVYLHE